MKRLLAITARTLGAILLLCACRSALAGQLERLPDTPEERAILWESPPPMPVAQMAPDAGLLARWRADHKRRAREDGMIQTDRPSFTLSDTTVPKGWLQLETGWNYLYSHQSFMDSGMRIDFDQHVNYLPELNLRYGVTSWAELRVEWAGVAMVRQEFSEASTGTVLAEGSFSDTANLGVGTKLQVSRQRGWIPTSAFVTEIYLPTSGGDDVTPIVDYIYTWQLGDSFSLGGSTGFVADDISSLAVDSFFQSAILRYHHTAQLALFAEWYTSLESVSADNAWFPMFDCGVQWRVRPNFQLDSKIGTPLGGEYQSDGVFTGVGASVRY